MAVRPGQEGSSVARGGGIPQFLHGIVPSVRRSGMIVAHMSGSGPAEFLQRHRFDKQYVYSIENNAP